MQCLNAPRLFHVFCMTFLAAFTALNATQLLAEATPSPSGHKINFTISTSQTVDNDTLSITFNRLAQGQSPQLVANEINQQMQTAINILKQYPDITSQTSQYHIRPVYNKNQIITHWTGQQSLTITLENKPGLVKVLASIQPYLAYQSMQFGVSDARKQQILDQLTQQAIQRFQARARLIAQGFQAPSFQILETHINTPNDFPVPHSLYARAEMMAADMAPPVIQSGQSDISVQISGTILLPQ